jgi:hypothetical protein
MKTNNPYVGPNALSSSDPIFGRDREIAEVLDLMLAERIVLLVSPSGAGKTSLIGAKGGVRDRLAAEGFFVLPTLRVTAPAQAISSGAKVNRYVAAAQCWLDTPAHEGTDLGDMLVRASEHRPSPTMPVALIFDQFEELLTRDPADLAVKAEFMQQLGGFLEDRSRWALFAMREEFAPAMQAYARWLPTRLSTRYRLDLLGPAAARDAIIRPAKSAAVTITAEAANMLIDDLRRIYVRREDRSKEVTHGPHVEPVQLQVVCQRLWQKLPDDATVVESTTSLITTTDNALLEYYSEEVTAVAKNTAVDEWTLRTWFDRELLTSRDFRTQVADDTAETETVRPALDALEKAHLIKPETRRGTTWYELAHDRLIAPVRESNQRWFRQHLTNWEREAAEWDQAGRPEEQLPRTRELLALRDWVKDNPHRAEVVKDFLSAAEVRALAREKTKTRTLRRTVIGVVTALVVVVAAGGVILDLFIKQKRANDQLIRQNRLMAEAGRQIQQANASPLASRTIASPVESLRADVQLQKLETPSPPAERRGVTIRYYRGEFDDERVKQALENLGFTVQQEIVPSTRRGTQTNAVWYGTDVPPEDVQVVALALIRAGVALQLVKPFVDQPRKRSQIEIGNKELASNALLTVQDIDRLSVEVRELYGQTAPGKTAY